MDTLVRAEQIKHDAKLMNAVQIEAKRQAQAIKAVSCVTVNAIEA